MPPIKRAVCVGLNYPGTSAALNGCVNDALDWQAALTARGYQVTLLLDQQGTASAILGALREAVAAVGWRGRGVFTFSGHGTYVPDRDGDEVDGYDEAIVPTDYRTYGVLTDDVLFSEFRKRRIGSRWLTISDSCHSGTLTRAFGVAGGETAESLKHGGGSVRYLPPADHLDMEVLSAVLRADPQVQDAPVVPRGAPRNSGVLMSGCDDPEVAYDASIGGRARGAFTAAALDALAEVEAMTTSPTYGQWHEAIRRRLPNSRFPQTPQLQADRRQRRWAALV